VPEGVTLGLIAILVLAVVFDYINGFHDTANAIATSVSTRALKPEYAIVLSATANFVGALTGTAVAQTIASGLVNPLPNPGTGVNPNELVIMAALIGGITWNLITWRLGIPSSSSHALIGGLIGASLAGGGLAAVQWTGVTTKVLIPLVGSPIIGFVGAFAFMVVVYWIFQRGHPQRLNGRFRRLQIVSATYMAFSHGSNDAQKTMGIMTLALFSAGLIETTTVPLPVILIAATAISLGTAAGGWRIIRTMGSKVVKLDPVHGFAAETTAATVILGASHFGIPVSTTQVIASAITGGGSVDRPKAVHWGVVGDIVTAWIFTLPAAGAIAGLTFAVLWAILK
jgi:inorganic phosphate transporter, PiT family